MTDDLLAWPLLVDLAAAMTAEIESAGLPDFCFVGIMPGAGVAFSYCEECKDACGMAWVRLASIREDAGQTIDGFSNCASVFVVNVEMGMTRCHQTFDGPEGEPMPMEYQYEKTRAQMAEQAAMRRVLLCSEDVQQMRKLLGQYTPIGPEGGCVGGAWTAQYEMF